MSRGVLELLSRFRIDSHLVKEHRIRLEISMVPLYDRSEKAVAGSALQEVKRVAKETYPIAPQLDACRLRYGLRHGGNGHPRSNVEVTGDCQESIFSWKQDCLFVSIRAFPLYPVRSVTQPWSYF